MSHWVFFPPCLLSRVTASPGTATERQETTIRDYKSNKLSRIRCWCTQSLHYVLTHLLYGQLHFPQLRCHHRLEHFWKQRCCFQIRHIKMGLCHVWRHSLKRVSSLTRHPTKLSKSMVYLESAYLPITECRTSVLSWKPGEEKTNKKKRSSLYPSYLGFVSEGR